ncbi:MAG: rRNA maturation RNase YbeY [Peptococcaceae bacterium]|nr:rRNA maturation RNase YbeY [Peptococcaceae bacterium]
MDINIIWETGTIADNEIDGFTDLLRQGLETALAMLDLKFESGPEIGLLVTDDEGIRILNRDYREINEPTDVLSFAMLEGEEEGIYNHERSILGDIVISAQTAARQAAEGRDGVGYEGSASHSLAWEMIFLSVHGLLHLCGYDHGSDREAYDMSQWETRIMSRIAERLGDDSLTIE